MPIQDELCFVQFMHPGREHGSDENGSKKWNRGKHKRKFVEIEGRCLKEEKLFEGPLHFWAEWEPESCVTEIAARVTDGPRFVHQPYYTVPKSYSGRQNTDPFVFDHFLYTGCQQHTSRGPTQLRYLKEGSVILFGSCVDSHFAIDTVFVVAGWQDHDAYNYKSVLKQRVPQPYLDVTLSPWYESKMKCKPTSCGDKTTSCSPKISPPDSYRLYFGATYENPIRGMYSFFPCMPGNKKESGFARPKIDIPDVITPSLLQGKKLNSGLAIEKIIEYWKNTRSQVEEAGCSLGIHATMPPRRTENDPCPE